MSKTKVIMVNGHPVTYEKREDNAVLTFYGLCGSVSLDFWGWEKKKKTLKELNTLVSLVQTMIDDIKAMECDNDDE